MVTPFRGQVPVILTIAGFDPSSGAGITADLKTIAAHDCYGMACITALTVQSTQGVFGVEPVSGDLIRQTLKRLAQDSAFASIKVGMLGSADIAYVVADFLQSLPGVPVVLDPIIQSSSGATLLDEAGLEVLRSKVLPLATVITPNLAEAEALTGRPVTNLSEMKSAAKELRKLGAKSVVVTGGHLAENTDVLLAETGDPIEVRGARVESSFTHGTGCAFSTAIACRVSKGAGLEEAVRGAKEYVRRAIEAAYPIGNGTGPINHLFRLR
jgi:hydroxymethylpyrimidine/phosphomethylpyrimidine kinase